MLDETQEAIRRILEDKGDPDHEAKSLKSRQAMERAFADATVTDYEDFLCVASNFPDPGDAHVIAAALKTRASTIVTENLSDFPIDLLKPLSMEPRTADDFIADTIDLDPGRAVAAIKTMRERFKKPDKTADRLLLDMEAIGLIKTVDVLKPHVLSL